MARYQAAEIIIQLPPAGNIGVTPVKYDLGEMSGELKNTYLDLINDIWEEFSSDSIETPGLCARFATLHAEADRLTTPGTPEYQNQGRWATWNQEVIIFHEQVLEQEDRLVQMDDFFNNDCRCIDPDYNSMNEFRLYLLDYTTHSLPADELFGYAMTNRIGGTKFCAAQRALRVGHHTLYHEWGLVKTCHRLEQAKPAPQTPLGDQQRWSAEVVQLNVASLAWLGIFDPQQEEESGVGLALVLFDDEPWTGVGWVSDRHRLYLYCRLLLRRANALQKRIEDLCF